MKKRTTTAHIPQTPEPPRAPQPAPSIADNPLLSLLLTSNDPSEKLNALLKLDSESIARLISRARIGAVCALLRLSLDSENPETARKASVDLLNMTPPGEPPPASPSTPPPPADNTDPKAPPTEAEKEVTLADLERFAALPHTPANRAPAPLQPPPPTIDPPIPRQPQSPGAPRSPG